jgi:pyruvate,water dikinase
LSRPFWQHRTWLRVVSEEMGFLIDTLDMVEIGGWLYLRVVPLLDKAGPPPSASLLSMMVQAVPELRQRIRRGIAAVDQDIAGQLCRRWRDEWRETLSARISSLRETDLDTVTDEELAERYCAALALSDDGSQIHFRLWGAVVVALGTLEFTCRELLCWADGRSIALLAGSSAWTTEPAAALARVAATLAEGADPRDALAADPAFAAAFADYQRNFGYRALTYDLADPTLAERPTMILSLIRDYTRTSNAVRETAEQALAQARRILAGHGEDARARFENDLARARHAYPVREENEFFTISMPLAILRQTALEIGRRLTVRRQLGNVDDVFFFEVPEMLAALRDGGDPRTLIARRQSERAWALAHPGPPTYGTRHRPVPLDTLPAQARQVNRAFWWALEQIAPPIAHRTGVHPIAGIPASPGRRTGTVRVVRDHTDFDQVRAGDVLVCPTIPPVWSVLIGTAGAIVTDQGGPLSHAAIIAREFGVPAVVATGDATSRLRDGESVTVDGTAGTVVPE